MDRYTKLTDETCDKLFRFIDNLLDGEKDVYTAWSKAGLSNTFQIYFNRKAYDKFRAKILAGQESREHGNFITLAMDMLDYNGRTTYPEHFKH